MPQLSVQKKRPKSSSEWDLLEISEKWSLMWFEQGQNQFHCEARFPGRIHYIFWWLRKSGPSRSRTLQIGSSVHSNSGPIPLWQWQMFEVRALASSSLEPLSPSRSKKYTSRMICIELDVSKSVVFRESCSCGKDMFDPLQTVISWCLEQYKQ